MHQPPEATTPTITPLEKDDASLLTVPSAFSDISSSSFASARFEAIESLQLLEGETTDEHNSTPNHYEPFRLLATAVYSSVVTDE